MSRIVPVFVGLDYADKFVQVCVLNRDGDVLLNRRADNDWSAIAGLVARHATGPVKAGIEVCTGAAHLADELRSRAGWQIDLAHTGYTARMKQSYDKHDFGDARMLADLVRVGYLPKVWLAPQEVRELRRLVRHREALIGERRRYKLRLRALLRDHRCGRSPARAWTKTWHKWVCQLPLPTNSAWLVEQHFGEIARLDARILAATKRLEEQTADDADVQALLKQKGVGLVTACVLRAEIGYFARFRNGKQVARFCGLSPRNVSSGERQADAGLIKAGSSLLRATLIEAAHRLIRHQPRWRELAGRLTQAGKPKCVIVAAVANRWVRWLYWEMVAGPRQRSCVLSAA
jgi:transposase